MPWRILLCAASIFITLGLGVPPTEAAGEQSTFDGITNAHLPEPLVRTLSTSAAEDRALLEALTAFQTRAVPDDASALSQFVSAHPHSGWAASILANEGAINLHAGYFSRATADWEAAWLAGKHATDPRAKVLVDGVVGHLAQLDASLGRFDSLSALFIDVGDRKISGSATEGWQAAHDTFTLREKSPQHLLLCGPVALSSLMLKQGATHDQVRFVHTYRTKQDGTSLADVARLAEQAKFAYRLVFRKPGQPVPVPSVVHWKVGHYSSIVARSGDRFRLEDAMFPGDGIWVTSQAIDVEASGYFLASATADKAAWRDVTADEASKVWGKGPTTDTRTGDAGDHPANPPPPPNTDCPLCGYNILESSVSLTLSDTPVGYNPPIGPSTKVKITYNQREASQPQNFNFYNVSPKWTLGWLTYITDDPANPGATVSRYLAGGGAFYYAGYNASTGLFTAQDTDGSILALVSQAPVTYQRRLQDGSVEIYAQSDGSSSYPRNVFLSKVIDPQGNALTLNYDNQQRLISLTDAVGRQTTLSYGSPTKPLLVTRITDPFGRSASLGYDALGRLTSITDVIGLTSSFTYDANSLVNSMKTPYGTTTFAYTAPGTSGPPRFVQITDPLGYNEREEWLEPAPIPDSDPPNTVPQGTPIPLTNQYLEYRNSFHWDKNAYVMAGCTPSGGCDYTKARITHFNHVPPNTDIKGTSIESVKYPLENRIWYIYPGQTSSLYGGIYNSPNVTARVLDDGSTQTNQVIYDSSGYSKKVREVDPLGRTTSYSYPNHIDLASVTQTTAAGDQFLAQLIYNAHHRPLYRADASGQVTTYSYNTAGQVTSVTDSLGNTTRFAYDLNNNLSSISNANGATVATFTYDINNRIATYTDSEGWSASFTYDNADRITQVIYPDGTTDNYRYNRLDLVSYTDRLKRTWAYNYDANRRLTSTTDPSGAATVLRYNQDGKLTSLIDAKGNATSWTYDVEGRVTSKVYADSSTVVYEYEQATSRLKRTTDALGQIKQFSYALDDQVTGLVYQTAINPTPSVTLNYDPYFPRVISMVDGTGTSSYLYGALGALGALRLQQETGPLANSATTYGYDALGRIASRSVAQAAAQTFRYDALGRLTNETNDLGTFIYAYLGQTRQMTKRSLSGGNVGTSWSYLPNANDRRLASVANTGFTTASFSNYQLITDSEAFIRGINETSDVAAVYPPTTNQTASYNTLNQLTDLSGQPLTYDANGNLISDGQRTFGWDAENRLVSIAYPSQPGKATAFAYDGLGRRTAITSTSAGGIAKATSYLWCASRICQARDATDTATRAYHTEGEYVFGSSPQSLYYGVDQIGSVRRVFVSPSTVPAYSNDPYGNTLLSSTRLADFGFAGMFYNVDSGLYLTWYRGYDPAAGRWIARDPIGNGDAPTSIWGSSAPSTIEALSLNLQSAYTTPSNLNDLLGSNDSLMQTELRSQSVSVQYSTPLVFSAAAYPYEYVKSNPLTTTDPTGLTPLTGDPWGMWTNGRTWRFFDGNGNADFDLDMPGHHHPEEWHGWCGRKRGPAVPF